MRILLLSAIDDKREIEESFDNLGLAYISSSIKSNLPESNIKIIQTSSVENLSEEIEEFRPDIVGISCVSQNYNIAIACAIYCKKNGICVLIGGNHISMLPETLSYSMDVGIIKEGEVTIVDLLKIFKNDKFDIEELKKINGIVFREQGKLIITPPRSLIEDLDNLPFPDRSIIRIDPNNVLIMSSRGCPYNCIFCSSKKFWGNVRYNSSDYVIKEIEELIEIYKAKRIIFVDDLFIENRERLKEIVNKIVEKGIDKKVDFTVQVRANLVNDELCELLKMMNVRDIMMGIESGSPTVLKFLKGNNVTVQDNEYAISSLKNYAFNVMGYFILGTPVDTIQTLEENHRFIKRNKLDDIAIFFLIPLPKTSVWELAEKKGLVGNDMDWNRLKFGNLIKRKLSDFDNALILSNLDKKILFKYYKKMYRAKRVMRIQFLLRLGIQNPNLIFQFMVKKIKWMIKYRE